MLEEFIKTNASVKFYRSKQLIDEKSDREEDLLCEGKVFRVLSDRELEVEIEEKFEQEFHKRECYIVYLLSSQNVFLCNVYFESTYSDEGRRIISLEMVSPLERVQRRNHQRVSCHAGIAYQIIQADQIDDKTKKDPFEIFSEKNENSLEIYEDTLVDISGGGIRFTSKKKIEPKEYLYAKFEITSGSDIIIMKVIGQVVYSGLLRNEQECYDIRMKYINVSELEREQIIRFVFQLERDSRNVKLRRGGELI